MTNGPSQARTTQKPENIVASEKEQEFVFDAERLAYAKIEGPGVTLAFQADDKNYVCILFGFSSLNV